MTKPKKAPAGGRHGASPRPRKPASATPAHRAAAAAGRAGPSAPTAALSVPLQAGTELLIYHAAELKSRLREALDHQGPGAHLTLDCAALHEIDGAGLQLLMSAAQHLRAGGGALRLAELSDTLTRQLCELGVDHWFSIDGAQPV